MERKRLWHIDAPGVLFIFAAAATAWLGCSGARNEAPGGNQLTEGGIPATCTSGVSCNPPPPETTCPPFAPPDGSYCNYQGPMCTFEFCVATDSIRTAQCKDHQWMTSAACYTPPPSETVCPLDAPQSGSYCKYQGPDCLYYDWSSYCSFLQIADQSAHCQNNQWTVYTTYCDPPWPDSGVTAPDSGTSGSADAGDSG